MDFCDVSKVLEPYWEYLVQLLPELLKGSLRREYLPGVNMLLRFFQLLINRSNRGRCLGHGICLLCGYCTAAATEIQGGIAIKIGYIRVSTAEQNTARQEVLMEELGVDMVFIDRASGKNAQRPELARMLEFVRKGDTVVVEAISRFARNTRDLLELVERLTTKGVEFVSRKEAIDTTTPSGKFMLTIFGAVAELEREYILQRQKEGIAIAKANGTYKGRPPTICPDFDRVVTQWQSGEITAQEASRRLGISPSTFYRKLKGGRQHD